MKAILLAGGTGSRLYPTTHSINKHNLLIYDKPMFYYPLSVLILMGIKEILILSTKTGVISIKKIINKLSLDKKNNVKIKYGIQKRANGIPEAFLIGKNFLRGSKKNVLLLGDNFFYSNNLPQDFKNELKNTNNSKIFLYKVSDPQNFGSINFKYNQTKIHSLAEKPKKPKNNFAITGLYFFDHNVVSYAKKLKKSRRGELEITDLLNMYLKKGKLDFRILSRGFTWFDMGTFSNIYNTETFVKIIQDRQGYSIADLNNLYIG